MRRGRGLYEEGVLEDRRATLFERIETWRSIQVLYMPGIAQLRQTHATQTDGMPDAQDLDRPEDVPLYLPSGMPSALWATGCVPGLLEKEKCLRIVEAHDALSTLRRQLRIMTGVFNYKKTHASLLPLRIEDVRGPTRQSDDDSEGRHTLSWIWLLPNVVRGDDSDEFEVTEGK